jgi:hypothetical protein
MPLSLTSSRSPWGHLRHTPSWLRRGTPASLVDRARLQYGRPHLRQVYPPQPLPLSACRTGARHCKAGAAECVGPLQRLPDRTSSTILATLRLLLFAIRTTRRNIVVAPGGVLGISSLVFHMLLCLLLSVVAPGVGDLIPQPAFSLLYVPDDSAVVGAAPTGEYGFGARQGQLLAAATPG